ncbi:MAG: bifunctional UDP-sugar hydrolase/5'-nucleotidase [Candidatus Edwardsbacteria bacterium]
MFKMLGRKYGKKKVNTLRHTVSLLFFGLVFVFSLSTAEEFQRLVILHTNDIHGSLEPQGATWINPDFPPELGGAASVATYIKQVRNESLKNNDYFLLLDAGDIYQGTPVGDKTKGSAVIKYFNRLHYDAWNAGNHDFDDGIENLKNLCWISQMPVLCANIESDCFKPYLIKNFGEIKVGIIGVITDDLSSLVASNKLQGIQVLPAAITLKKYVSRLRDQGCELIIVLSHLGFPHKREIKGRINVLEEILKEGTEKGLTPYSEGLINFVTEKKGFSLDDLEIARLIDGIDLIIGGHTHVGIEPPYEDEVTHAVVVQAYSSLTSIGRMDLLVEKKKKGIAFYKYKLIILFWEEFPSDLEMKELIASEVKKAEEGMQTCLGFAKKDIGRGDYESPLGNLITDAMREASGADVALINRGGIRADLKAGDITEEDVYRVLPFGDILVKFPVTGKQLKEILEVGVSGKRRDTQLSGVKIVWNPNFPEGKRLCEVRVGDELLNLDKTYTFVTSDYLARGAIGYTILVELSPARSSAVGGADKKDAYLGGLTLREALIEYIKKHSPLEPKIEGRNVHSQKAKYSKEMEEINKRIYGQ